MGQWRQPGSNRVRGSACLVASETHADRALAAFDGGAGGLCSGRALFFDPESSFLATGTADFFRNGCLGHTIFCHPVI